MIIYGVKTTTVAQEPVFGTCPHCGQSNTLTLIMMRRYLHIFWIPTFPIGMIAATQCSHCQQALVGKNKIPAPAKQLYEQKRGGAPRPLWMYIGLLLLIMLLLGVIITNATKG